MTMQSGLDQLKALKNLQELDVEGMEQRIGVNEAQWMTMNWPKLRVIRGLFDRGSNLQATEWLRVHAPEVKDFLKQLNSILLEAALATEPDLIRKMKSSREQAAKIMETFMAEQSTVVHDQSEQQDPDEQLSQPEAVNEQERQQNNGEPSCHLLRYVLDLMRVGRFRRAIEDITGCWTLDDCQVIVQYGVAIFQQQKINEDSGYMSFVRCIGHLMREGIHERFFDSERQGDLANILILPDKATKCPKPSMILWFFWMNSPYMVTPKLLLSKNMGRDEHLAYLVCYWNSYDTRKLMGKLDADDTPDASRTPVAFDLDNGPWRRRRRLAAGLPQDRTTPETKPISFRQTNSGQCCTLALFNFLANQKPCLQSEIVKTILSRTCNDEANYDLYAADQDVSLRSLHYWLLSDRDTDQLHEEQGPEDLEEYDSPQPSGNHMIVIMPFAGYVWEIDSYHQDSPLCLGDIKDDWRYIAHERLKMWTEAAVESRVCNDVHAIVRE
ncbi:hypothetical protein EC968_007403 [Mortierella alpina]|nr:hypothetical protein EC968_007403 [Mortierella alpina]